ncbi:MAG: hypothetical protein HY547_01670 [Elusimicrobia bacterium]|nr:hypothetical protein [Elusimicrobiota bacterium]
MGLLLISIKPSWAFNFEKLSFDGAIDVKGEFAVNEKDFSESPRDDRNAAHLNIMLGLSGELAEGMKTRIEAYREPINEAESPARQAQYGQAMQGAGNELGVFALENLYLHFDDLFLGVKARFGWQYMGDDLDLVGFTGRYNDDSLTITHADSAFLERHFGPFAATLFQAVTRDVPSLLTDTDYTLNNVALTTGTSSSHWYVKKIGLSAKTNDLFGETAPSLTLGLNLHQGQDRGAATVSDNINLLIYELTARGSSQGNNVHYYGTLAANAGRRNAVLSNTSSGVNFRGRLWHAGGEFLANKHLGFSLQAAQATGDDDPAEPSDISTNEEPDYSFHDLGALGMAPKIAFGEILGKSNTLTGGRPLLQGFESGSPLISGGQGRGFDAVAAGAHYALPSFPKVKIFADYILAYAQKLRNGSDLGKSRKIGDELDIAVHYQKLENVTLKLSLAALKPAENSAVLGNGANINLVRKITAGATMIFQ